MSICCYVFRDPLGSLASWGPQDSLVTLGSCRGWVRRERLGTQEVRDHQVSQGQMDVKELWDRKVLLGRKETL